MTEALAFWIAASLIGAAAFPLTFAFFSRLPVRFVGTGEKAGDLAPFEPQRFVEALFA